MENRYQCPFYGFYLSQIRTLVNQNGNQCALIVGSYGPCKMEFEKETPNWNECPFNNTEHKKLIEEIVNSCTVFPEGFSQGISMIDWMNRVKI